ncbi:transposase [Streptomyces himastatinicus]|uniref:transposase n=1 Tax=Streptomyces himastatinicus TaxID=998084 RepID=UPI0001B4BA0D
MFVLHTACRWRDLPPQLGYGSGHTAWRRLRAWQAPGYRNRLHRLVLNELSEAELIGRGLGHLIRRRISAAPVLGQGPPPATTTPDGECAGRVETSRRRLRVGGQSGILTRGRTSDQLPAERSPSRSCAVSSMHRVRAAEKP